jgi:hypothetical protein
LLKKCPDFKRILLGNIFIRTGSDPAEDVFQGRFRRIVRSQTNFGERKGGLLIP